MNIDLLEYINGFLSWLNQNSGLLTFLTVVTSLITCIFSMNSSKAAWAQVNEMEKQYDEENRPYIEVEFIYERRLFYILRFVNHGRNTAQNVKIVLEDDFVNSLNNVNLKEIAKNLKNKSCVIGVGQHYDLFIGTNEYLKVDDKVPAKGIIMYQSKGEIYKSEFEIDFNNYATFFSTESYQEKNISLMKRRNDKLDNIDKKLERIALQLEKIYTKKIDENKNKIEKE